MVPQARLELYKSNREAGFPDSGSTALECCPDLNSTASSLWNQSYIVSLTDSFIGVIERGGYTGSSLPPNATDRNDVSDRFKIHLQGLIRKRREQDQAPMLDDAVLVNRRKVLKERRQSVRLNHSPDLSSEFLCRNIKSASRLAMKPQHSTSTGRSSEVWAQAVTPTRRRTMRASRLQSQ